MKDWKNTLAKPDQSLSDAMRLMDQSSAQIVLVVDARNHLLGTVSDGDIRRSILKGAALDSSLEKVMCKKPTTGSITMNRAECLALLHRKTMRHLPLVDDHGEVLGLFLLLESLEQERHDNWVVLMAGGLGSRLGELTKDCPKPLLRVGNKPLLETIMDQFIQSGFHRFYFSVNYLGEMIEEYFGDGSKWGVEIRYVKEKDRLGTAGALSLLPERPTQPIIVMNGDVLTKLNFQNLLEFHEQQAAQATMCVREYDFQVPYGVVQVENHQITSIDEKPVHRFFVNAGIYALSPGVLDLVPEHKYLDMPHLFEKIKEEGNVSAAYPLREYWIDIGQKEDFNRADLEFGQHFD